MLTNPQPCIYIYIYVVYGTITDDRNLSNSMFCIFCAILKMDFRIYEKCFGFSRSGDDLLIYGIFIYTS